MTSTHLQLGGYGESLACDSLIKKGYSIIVRNFRSKYGEIDVIAKKDDHIAFVEVKSRIGDRMGKPYEAVTRAKLHKIMQTAQLYALQKNLKNYKLSVHVVSIVFNEDRSVKSLEHFENVSL